MLYKKYFQGLLAQVIKDNFLHYPSKGPPILNKPEEHINGQMDQPVIVDKLLKGKRDGFFIESGAYDGEIYSNSLFFELKRNWTGLLIEPNPTNFKWMMTKNRNAIAINTCLSNRPFAEEVPFLNAALVGGIADLFDTQLVNAFKNFTEEGNKISYSGTAQCFPLYDILVAVGNPTVDFFSLDVEGAEQGILESIPWDKVDIKVILIEIDHSEKEEILEIMTKQNYEMVQNIQEVDMLFVRRDFLKTL